MASVSTTKPDCEVEIISVKWGDHQVLKRLRMVLDMREIPDPQLKCPEASENPQLTGRHSAVQKYLDSQASFSDAQRDMAHFLNTKLEELQSKTTGTIQLAIACTGGKHRSVYLAEIMAKILQEQTGLKVSVRHCNIDTAESSATELPESVPSSGSADPPQMYRYNVARRTFDEINVPRLSDDAAKRLLQIGLERKKKKQKLVETGAASAT